MTGFPRYSRFLSPRIVKTANTKTANSEGRLYIDTYKTKSWESVSLRKKLTFVLFSFLPDFKETKTILNLERNFLIRDLGPILIISQVENRNEIFFYKYFFGVTCPIWLSLLFSLVFLPSSDPTFPSSF